MNKISTAKIIITR